jgi:hypothetical protein
MWMPLETYAAGQAANIAGNVPGAPGSPTRSVSYVSGGSSASSSSGGGQIPSYSVTPRRQTVEEQRRYDPWSAYRSGAAADLEAERQNGSPADIYRDKLEQMATGEFTANDPSYQFRFQQGQQAAERSLASKGLLNSGNAAIELQNYGQGAASQEYGAQFDRMLKALSGVESQYDTQMQRLMKMAGVDIDPTAGGRLNAQQDANAIAEGQLGINAQKVNNDYTLGLQQIAAGQRVDTRATGVPYVNDTPNYSWSSYYAAEDAARAARGAAGYGPSGNVSYSSNSYI